MTTYYVDPVNGNNSNDGLSWNTAHQTLSRGKSYSSDVFNYFLPGDIIKIVKSPDPVSIGNITWNNNDFRLDCSQDIVKKLDYSYRAATRWIASANISYSLIAGGKCVLYSYGSISSNYYAHFIPGSSFTTGKMAYISIPQDDFIIKEPPYDYSGYTKISFWMRVSASIPANCFKVCLCSDTVGNTIVNEFFIPGIRADLANKWIPITLTNGTSLGNTLQTIALYAVSDPGITQIDLCGMIACNDLTYTCLISKNSLATGGVEAWYPIDAILDGQIALATTSNKNYAVTLTVNKSSAYSGVTEEAVTYIREPIPAITNYDWLVCSSGEPNKYIEFQGGYNPSTDEQDGETFYDFQGAQTTGFYAEGQFCLLLNRLNPIRAYRGMYFNECVFIKVIANTLCGHSESGIKVISQDTIERYNPVNYSSETLYDNYLLPKMILEEDVFENNIFEIDILGLVNNETAGLTCERIINSYFKIRWISGGSGIDPYYTTSNFDRKGLVFDRVFDSIFELGFVRDILLLHCTHSVISATEIQDIQIGITNGNIEYYLYEGTEKTVIQNCRISSIITTGTEHRVLARGTLVFRNCILDESFTLAPNSYYFQDANLRAMNNLSFEKINGDPENNRIYVTYQQIIESQKLVRHSSPGIAWKMYYYTNSENLADRLLPRLTNYFSFSIAKVFVKADSVMIFSAWFLRESEFVVGRLICRTNAVLGLNKILQTKMTVGANVWEKLSIEINPSESGVVEIEARITLDSSCIYVEGGVYWLGGYNPIRDPNFKPVIYVDDFSYEG